MLIKVSVALFAILTISVSVEPPWVWQNPKPQGNAYQCISVINENIVFVGDRNGGTILKTTDGGLSWHINYTPCPYLGVTNNYRIYSIDFPDAMTGYASGAYRYLMKTTDQGVNWVFYGDTAARIIVVDFPQGNNQIGYAVGGFGINADGREILKTTNGGQTWVQQNCGATAPLNALHVLDVNTVYAVSQYGQMLKTTDGGTNWITLPLSAEFSDVYFVNHQTGFVCGTYSIFKTTNGGSSWSRIWYNENSVVYSVYFPTPQIGYASGINGAQSITFITKTTNGGSSWNPVYLPKYMTWALPIEFASAQIGYAAGFVYSPSGGYGQLLKTTDAGATWNFLNSGPEETFRAVDFPENDQIGYVAGDLGSMYKTTDGGANWIRQNTSTSQIFYDVDFLNNQLGFAVGSNGTFFKTTDGGNVWTPKNSNTTARLLAVKFVNPQVGYIGGWTSSDGVILKTTNGGDNWVTQTVPNNDYYRAIQDLFFFNADTGYAVAGATEESPPMGGRIYKTTNGGQTWVVNYTPPQIAGFYAIDFPVNSQVGYVSGIMGSSGEYKILKTTNGGNSWTPQRLDHSIVPAVSVSFADNNIGFAGFLHGGSHRMMKTTNGGANWFPPHVTTTRAFNDIQAINSNIVYAVGDGGMIRKTTNGGDVWIAEEKEKEKMVSKNGMLKVYPNPFRNHLQIRFQIPDARYQFDNVGQGFSLAIYDVTGRVVKSFNPASSIQHQVSSIVWYGEDDLGRKLPAGVYFVSLKAGEFKVVEKAVLLE